MTREEYEDLRTEVSESGRTLKSVLSDDYITLNVPPGTFSNVPLRIWSLSVRQSYYYFCFFLLIESPFSSTRTALAVRRSMIASAKVGSLM